jgi:hypothetical protein
MGIGDWGLGIGDWGLANPQSPIPNPQSPIPKKDIFELSFIFKKIKILNKKILKNNSVLTYLIESLSIKFRTISFFCYFS